MPFTATLTNPLPKGQIETSGTFGPWQKDDPGATPLEGNYNFQNADLGTIKGIGGILGSKGDVRRPAGADFVKGETHVPDFHLTSATSRWRSARGSKRSSTARTATPI